MGPQQFGEFLRPEVARCGGLLKHSRVKGKSQFKGKSQ
jgi:hypothetical protein